MPRLYIDGFREVLTVEIANGTATSVVLPTGAGAKLAALTLSASDYLVLRFQNGTIVETMWATARTGDTLTVLRAQEGTGATPGSVGYGFPIDSVVRAPVTAVGMRELANTTAPIILTAQTAVPGVPDAGTLALWARSRAGRMLLEMMGPSGLDTALQPALFGNNVQMWGPSTGTTVSPGLGTSWTARNAGTGAAQSHPVRATTNRATKMSKGQFSTGTTATGQSGVQSALETWFRGDAAGDGGVFWFTRFAFGVADSTLTLLLGTSALNAALGGEPSVQNNTMALGFDSTDTNYQVISRNATTTTKLDTGLAKTTTGVVFDFTMFARSNASVVTVRLVNQNTGVVVLDNVDITSTLPVNTAFLYSHAQCRSTVSATAKTFWLNRIYADSDIT